MLKTIGKKILKNSDFVRNNYIKILTKKRVYNANHKKTPQSLVFFVTSRCNARCSHCFYWKELNKTSELNLEDIEKIASSIKHKYNISLTGGEPFLREDFFEICKIFYKYNKNGVFEISTNGYDPEKIYTFCDRLLDECRGIALCVHVSLDGPKDLHNKIRGIDIFDKAISTIIKLKSLKEKGNFDVQTIITLTKYNYKSIDKLIKYLIPLEINQIFCLVRAKDYGVYNLDHEIVTELTSKEELAIPTEELDTLFNKIKELNDNSEYPFWSKYQQLYLKYSIEITKNKKRFLKCYAGNVDAVIYPNGDISLCEMIKPFGNLKETDFNLYKIWNSEKANNMRDKIKSCVCTHGCNMSTNITLDKDSILKVYNNEKIN